LTKLTVFIDSHFGTFRRDRAYQTQKLEIALHQGKRIEMVPAHPADGRW